MSYKVHHAEPNKLTKSRQAMNDFANAFAGGDLQLWDVFFKNLLPAFYLIALKMAKGDKDQAEEIVGELAAAIVQALTQAKQLRYQ